MRPREVYARTTTTHWRPRAMLLPSVSVCVLHPEEIAASVTRRGRDATPRPTRILNRMRVVSCPQWSSSGLRDKSPHAKQANPRSVYSSSGRAGTGERGAVPPFPEPHSPLFGASSQHVGHQQNALVSAVALRSVLGPPIAPRCGQLLIGGGPGAFALFAPRRALLARAPSAHIAAAKIAAVVPVRRAAVRQRCVSRDGVDCARLLRAQGSKNQEPLRSLRFLPLPLRGQQRRTQPEPHLPGHENAVARQTQRPLVLGKTKRPFPPRL
jgi:hypothetical protein